MRSYSMKRILVIDDDDEIRTMISEVLDRSGYETAQAANGNEGMILHRQRPADLVITDIFMPEKEGVETIRELKTLTPSLKIIAISGGAPSLDKTRTLNFAGLLGADLTLSKPVVLGELIDAVKSIIG
jgi:CheY-like chemotaxis protein